MIVTVQIVFCYLKEAFQSLLFKYREGHSVDNVEGGQLNVKPMNELKDSAISEFCNSFFTIILLCLVQEIIQRGESSL